MSGPQSMSVAWTFNYSTEEVPYVQLAQAAMGKTRIVAVAFGFVVGSILIVLAVVWHNYGLGALGLAAAAIMAIGWFTGPRTVARRWAQRRRALGVQDSETVSVSLDASGVHVESGQNKAHYDWDLIHKRARVAGGTALMFGSVDLQPAGMLWIPSAPDDCLQSIAEWMDAQAPLSRGPAT